MYYLGKAWLSCSKVISCSCANNISCHIWPIICCFHARSVAIVILLVHLCHVLQLSFFTVACYKKFATKFYLEILVFLHKLRNLIGLGVKFITCRHIMPPTWTGRTNTGDGNAQTNMSFGTAIFRHLTTAQL